LPVTNPPATAEGLEGFYRRERPLLSVHAENDPVSFAHRFDAPPDKEVAAFLASQFAYGNVRAMRAFLEAFFESMGESPLSFVQRGDFEPLRDLYYRFHKGDDIIALLSVLRRIVGEWGSMGAMMDRFYDGDTREMLWRVREHLFGSSGDLLFFFPKRLPANPLKRWMLFLRWMVRRDDIDLGLWDFIDPASLVVPLDTHLFKIGVCLGWTGRRSPTWKAAVEITDALRLYAPEDPLKYDFLLCHRVGMDLGCTGRRSEVCAGRCPLIEEPGTGGNGEGGRERSSE
jgi:uncharacterized protein (TIGR02757 family)